MGTRNLTAVYLNGEHKVAQYCQWDGYPGGQGLTALNFLRKTPLDRFKAAVGNCSFLSEEEIWDRWQEVGADDSGWATMAISDRFDEKFPELHRSTGAGVLQLVLDNGGLALKDSLDFAAEGMFCEWAYVIDLDANTFEVYSGFRTEGCTGRFAEMDDPSAEYYRPVSLVATYLLDNLPTSEEFLDLENEPA